MGALPAIALTTGEPAGIGPELCLAVAARPWAARLVAVGPLEHLRETAARLGSQVKPVSVSTARPHRAGELQVLDIPLAVPTVPGRLDPRNAEAVLSTLRRAARGCLEGEFDGMVTAPVHKGVMNDAGYAFSGHTEFLGELAGGRPVMLLVSGELRVALATTHLPLRDVPAAITPEGLDVVLRGLHAGLRERFGITEPRILVAGLNPHAGESGHLGDEEIRVIAPTLQRLRAAGLSLEGPLPADTLFTPERLAGADAVLAMYHDQGLPVLKYAGFGRAVNITMGIPLLRTSVDHGTALDIAGRGRADPGSMAAALELAIEIAARTAASA
ncbi:4-hydroxythreonine-4-phosphate dehydrogenase PdxA [Wenzhouxiangella sp. XN24]|uniref:4-hydroxythreonine-4-phosphate dehydrogenase PdxA n=1 Tax=Wenzhouxiangella sp. XN24 TaxID=2713569 RepID=UPI0013EA464E|nr:4-hydroxythreonine-4-phosphate dehydrogenase PdxA [Wenzhouxiangella sp. XN24]NGX15797.1 4-hydroxythreonine-4-phosphate dehydrogenase PdxA [Wenzhouxiangella sp. XN24]